MSIMPANAPSAKPVPAPRPSASLVVVNARNEILLVQRNPQARSFGGMTVFPGGNFDEGEDDSLAITAIRETFEESGLLLARPKASNSRMPSDAILDEARHAIHSRQTTFRDFLDTHGLEADTHKLLPFTQWITPIGPPRRFRTQFYVTFLRDVSASGFSAGDKQERIPKPDGGLEVISARFMPPSAALDECRSGNIAFMPPQFYIIQTLNSILVSSQSSPDERQRVAQLARGTFGSMIINPRGLPAKDAKGRSVLTYEGDESRGGKPGRRHRVMVKMDSKTGGLTKDIELERNFDIFTEIDWTSKDQVSLDDLRPKL
ncbi:hypothetical protein HGRIS_000672 [Hohenbuehelia grisea]|uniref:Nudix hydrolase domain-containing protein n=1 Tax=Hohenbuehelia grisea TaxID=104357 RepID=A0ABR3JRW5_9AGAR